MVSLGLVAAALGLAAAGCASAPDGGKPGSPRAEFTRILGAVQAATGATPKDAPAWHEPENLYEYAGGDAGRFTDAGFVLLAHTDWQPAAGGPATVTLDLFDMGTPLGALDILCDSRTEYTQYVDIGNECHASDDLLELRIGRTYACLAAKPRADAAARTLMRTLAEALAKVIPAGPSDSDLVAPLPAPHRVPHTAAYTAKGFSGHPFLTNVREAVYEAGAKHVRLILMDAGTPEKATAMFAEWKDFALPRPADEQELANSFTYTDEAIGSVIVTTRGCWVVAAGGDPAAARTMLTALASQLP
jgi:hypothetical protein